MNDNETLSKRRIAAARQALVDAAERDPVALDRVNLRLARLSAARKRERDRIEQRVLGRDAPPPILTKPAGMSKQAWKVERKRLLAAAKTESLADKWKGKQGTPETLEAAERTHVDSLDQLERNGTIDKEQREWAAQIANVHRSIEADVAVSVASMEARVDQSRSAQHLVGESIRRVRLHYAYTLWRAALPAPKQMILDMIVGDAIGYTVAAHRHGVHNRTARKRLLNAISSWPEFVDRAYRAVSEEDVARANAA